MQGAGGWHHPIHIHLLDYLMLYGTGRDRSEFADWDILTQVRFFPMTEGHPHEGAHTQADGAGRPGGGIGKRGLIL